MAYHKESFGKGQMGQHSWGPCKIRAFDRGTFWDLLVHTPKSARACLLPKAVKISYFRSGLISVDPFVRNQDQQTVTIYNCTPNPPTKIVGFGGFDSSTILIQKGGIPTSLGPRDFPRKFDSSNVSRDNVSREIGRKHMFFSESGNCRYMLVRVLKKCRGCGRSRLQSAGPVSNLSAT